MYTICHKQQGHAPMINLNPPTLITSLQKWPGMDSPSDLHGKLRHDGKSLRAEQNGPNDSKASQSNAQRWIKR